MDSVFERLEQVLTHELDVHSTLLASAREMNRAIRESDTAGVQKHLSVHDDTLCRIEKLEGERMECCTLLARSMGISKRQPRLSQLLVKMPERWKPRLGELRKSLAEKIAELSRMTASNRILLEEGLRMMGHRFTLVQRSWNPFSAYGNRGQLTPGLSSRTFINRTA